MKIVNGNLVTGVTKGVIMHQVNCQGVMASGIAKELRAKYPIVWERYEERCKLFSDHELLGLVQVLKVTPDLYVANLFGQRYYGREKRRYTSYDALDEALATLAWQLQGLSLTSADCHHPLIGCGLGGADWQVVSALISRYLPDSTLWVLDTRTPAEGDK
jgi:O-acetyl-ADP-ribose deacetylase (regulator of RNase III)